MSEAETARLLLRRWQDDDLERLVALYGDPRVARFLSVDGRPWPRERSVGAFEHFVRQWQEYGFGPWAAIDRRTGGWLGQVGLNELPRWPGPDKVEVGWDLHPSVWGQGLATEGAWAALGYGFEVVGLERIISTARADNAASRRVMEKCGLAFQEEFTHKGALVAWYAIDRADWQAGQAAASRSVASLDGLVGPAVTQGRAAAGRRAPRRASVHRQRPGHA